jgi:hypothetical protein
MNIVRIVVGSVILSLSAPAAANAELLRQLAKPVMNVLSSSKQPSDLQLCAADAIGQSYTPIPFPPDGSGTVQIFGFGGLMGAGTVHRVISLVKTVHGTRIEVRTRTNAADADLESALRNCL